MVLVSAIINGVFFLITWQIEELQVHPMRLFSYILAFDTSALLVVYMMLNSCKFQLAKIFAATVLYDTSCESENYALDLLSNWGSVLTIFTICGGFCLQFCLSLDLILTLKKPFTPKEPRVNFYLFFSGLFSIFSASFMHIYQNGGSINWFHIVNYSNVTMIILSWILSINSIIYGCFKLGKPNIS